MVDNKAPFMGVPFPVRKPLDPKFTRDGRPRKTKAERTRVWRGLNAGLRQF